MRDNENQPIFKGQITEWGPTKDAFGAPTMARVVPITAPDAPTRYYAINYTCRDPRCDLQLGTIVWCARAEDGDGIILARADGNNTQHYPGDMTIEKGKLPAGDVTVEASLKVNKNASIDGNESVQGSVAAQGNVTAGSISLQGHTHGYNQGETTGPH